MVQEPRKNVREPANNELAVVRRAGGNHEPDGSASAFVGAGQAASKGSTQ